MQKAGLPNVNSDPFAPIDGEARWHGWKSEIRHGQPAKRPISRNGTARVNDPSSWMTRQAAEVLVDQQQLDGLGVQLGLLKDSETVLIGIDLDTCLSADGKVTDWANDVVDLIGSYTEISPSGIGLKIFGLSTTEALERFQPLLSPHGARCWKRSGSLHPPSIDLYLGNRFFAVTFQHWGSSPARLALVRGEALESLICEIGPNFPKG
jgi:putative DNA primase/helicase